MNQRSSHFSLGSNAIQYNSVYTKDYLPKQSKKNDAVQHQPFRGSSVQNKTQTSSFQTTNNAYMKNWGHPQHSKLDPKKLQNLRGHHFNLGNYHPTQVHTSHQMFYNRKITSDDASKTQQQSKTKMRSHNHDFKQQNFTNFQSSYSSQYSPHQINNENNGNKKLDGSSAIVLGNMRTPMLTSNALDYPQKKNLAAFQRPKGSLQQTSALVLGNDSHPREMQTMNQLYYNKKDIAVNELPQATMKQLRSTHFNLGTMKSQYETENQLYQSIRGNQIGQKAKHTIQQSGTWVDKNAKFTADTTNRRQLGQRQVQPYQKHTSSIKAGFQLGSSKNNYETQFKKNFLQQPQDLSNHIPIERKQGNVVIGCEQGHYISQHKANFISQNLKDAQTSGASIKAMNSEDHFKIGSTQLQPKLTTYQDQYRKDIENKNKMFHNSKS